MRHFASDYVSFLHQLFQSHASSNYLDPHPQTCPMRHVRICGVRISPRLRSLVGRLRVVTFRQRESVDLYIKAMLLHQTQNSCLFFYGHVLHFYINGLTCHSCLYVVLHRCNEVKLADYKAVSALRRVTDKLESSSSHMR